MEKFDSKKHEHLLKDLPFSYVSLPSYLDLMGYVMDLNGEGLICVQDMYFKNDFPFMFFPKKKENWERATMCRVSAEQVQKIKDQGIEIKVQVPTVEEFYYKTQSLIEPKKKIRERINQFKNNYEYEIFDQYDRKKLEKFYFKWKGQRSRASKEFEDESEQFIFFYLDKLDQYDIKQIYVEVDGKLAGFAWGQKHHLKNKWAGLHLKVDYQYKGLSRFLHHERAKLFSDFEEFTLGSDCKDSGLEQFKKELGPFKSERSYYVFTKDKK